MSNSGADLTRFVGTCAQQMDQVRQGLLALVPSDAPEPLKTVAAELGKIVGTLGTVEQQWSTGCGQLAQAYQKTIRQQHRYQGLFEFAPDGYVVTDLRGVIQEANQAACRLFNIAPEVLTGTPLAVLLAPGTNGHLSDLLSRLRLQAIPDEVVGWEMTLQPQQRPSISVAVTLAVRRDEDERPIGLSWLLRDLTTFKRAERLAAIGQMMTGLAHESRNALQRSQACLEMLKLEVGDRPRALELMNRLQIAQDHLHRLYDSIRDFAAPVRLNKARCSLSTVWREAWDRIEIQRQDRKVTMQEEIGGNDECSVDAFRMTQVFRNLFENALAACSDPVEISIQSSVKGDHLRVTIRDNGPGFPAGQEEKAFEPFYTTKLHGTGLGLALARRIVEEHGGKLVPSMSRGKGAEIILTIPRGDV